MRIGVGGGGELCSEECFGIVNDIYLVSNE